MLKDKWVSHSLLLKAQHCCGVAALLSVVVLNLK